MLRTCDEKIPTFISHGVEIPPCCPVSGNPLSGSKLTVCYRPKGVVFPVENLQDFVAEYVGGHPHRNIRNMEEMVKDLAVRVADEVGVPVRVFADLLIQPPYGGVVQTMRVAARWSLDEPVK